MTEAQLLQALVVLGAALAGSAKVPISTAANAQQAPALALLGSGVLTARRRHWQRS